MEAEDSGIFLFAGSKSKTKTVAEPVPEEPVLIEEIPVVEAVWKSRPKVRRSLPVLTDDLKKIIVVSGEDILRMSAIYAKTVAHMCVFSQILIPTF